MRQLPERLLLQIYQVTTNLIFIWGRSETLLGFGFNISNIGSKISYDGGTTSMFLPANLRMGVSLGYPIDPKNTLSLSFDVNKLLVPTPKLPEDGETPDEVQKRIDDYNNISSIGGVFKSFADAPGGFKEELQEVTLSLGAEYVYDNQFFVRAGYYNENEYKGSRRFFAFGGGFKKTLSRLMLPISYQLHRRTRWTRLYAYHLVLISKV